LSQDEAFNLSFHGLSSKSNFQALLNPISLGSSELSEKHKVVRFDYGEKLGAVQTNFILKSFDQFFISSTEVYGMKSCLEYYINL